MPIRISDSLTKEKKVLKTIKDKNIGIYTCGVTVYDNCHIGHARSLYIFDVIKRYLRYRGYKVKFVRNITDIDDKIINKAKESGKTAKEISTEYIKSYREDLKALGIDEADKEPLATEHIPDMIKHISGLIDKGFAYVVDGDVYFSVKKFEGYGKLSGQDLEQMMAGARIDKDEKKQDPLDFALWKKSKEGEPKWSSPWGDGRPGWHIECSAMSTKYLGETFDIHAGGRDLIFPHHENEIAQSEALSGKPFANYWIHHGLLTINGQKMAKSLGNFVTIKEFVKDKDADLLKLFFLSAHYSQPIDFTEEKIEECKKQKSSFDRFFEKVDVPTKGKSLPPFSKKNKEKVNILYNRFEQAMDNDFNMPQALGYLFELRDLTFGFTGDAYDYARAKLETCFNIFGLKIKPQIDLPENFSEQQHEREEAKKNRNYKKSDEIRSGWKIDKRIVVSDTNFGVTVTGIADEG